MLTDEVHTSQDVQAKRKTECLDENTKVCPRCGATLFRDMHVCYGCLYDFDATQRKSFLATNGYIDTENDMSSKKECIPTGRVEMQNISEKPSSHSLPDSADDTIDLSEVYTPRDAEVEIITASMEVRREIPIEGITIGRDSDNDVILRDRTVSRHHLRIIPDVSGVLALNQGATNPALCNGVPILDSTHVALGDSIEICGVRLKVVNK